MYVVMVKALRSLSFFAVVRIVMRGVAECCYDERSTRVWDQFREEDASIPKSNPTSMYTKTTNIIFKPAIPPLEI
jgi:hypothetical protein